MILYPDVIHIPEEIFHSGGNLAVASRTGERLCAKDLMKLYGIYAYFRYKKIYSGSRIIHFNLLKEKTALFITPANSQVVDFHG